MNEWNSNLWLLIWHVGIKVWLSIQNNSGITLHVSVFLEGSEAYDADSSRDLKKSFRDWMKWALATFCQLQSFQSRQPHDRLCCDLSKEFFYLGPELSFVSHQRKSLKKFLSNRVEFFMENIDVYRQSQLRSFSHFICFVLPVL